MNVGLSEGDDEEITKGGCDWSVKGDGEESNRYMNSGL
jgi:hypothetical protein